jgi:hypothetical protein
MVLSCLSKGEYDLANVKEVFADQHHSKVKFNIGGKVVPVEWERTTSQEAYNVIFTPVYKPTAESLAKLQGRNVTVTITLPCEMNMIVINN